MFSSAASMRQAPICAASKREREREGSTKILGYSAAKVWACPLPSCTTPVCTQPCAKRSLFFVVLAVEHGTERGTDYWKVAFAIETDLSSLSMFLVSSSAPRRCSLFQGVSQSVGVNSPPLYPKIKAQLRSQVQLCADGPSLNRGTICVGRVELSNGTGQGRSNPFRQCWFVLDGARGPHVRLHLPRQNTGGT